MIGILWAIAFYTWYRDDPSTHRGVNRSELAMLPPSRETAVVHGPIPWRTLLSNPTIWLICAQYVCLAYGWWFYITWLPTYLSEARGTGAMEGALLAGMPLLLGGVGCIVSAALTPVLARRTSSVSVARRILAVTGFAGASISSFVFTSIQDPMMAMLVLSIASFFNDFVMPPAWAACMDVGGRYSGTVSGAMNMMGGIAGGCSPAGRRLPARLDVPGVDRHLLCFRGHLLDGRALLAVSRHADADRRAHHGTPCRLSATSPAHELAPDDVCSRLVRRRKSLTESG